MGLSRAHGFLTAAVAGPGSLDASEWIRLVFDEPVFADGEEGREMLGLAVRVYRDIELGLSEPRRFRPVLVHRGHGTAQAMDASPWCTGFISRFRLFPEYWHPNALKPPLSSILHLSAANAVQDTQYGKYCDALPLPAAAVYRYWRENSQSWKAFRCFQKIERTVDAIVCGARLWRTSVLPPPAHDRVHRASSPMLTARRMFTRARPLAL